MVTKYKVGFHVSIAGGISNSVDNAQSIGCCAFQIFSRNPRGWAAKPLDSKDVTEFKKKVLESGIERESIVVHMPYLPNLSGPESDLYTKSIETLSDEITRSGQLGIPYLVVHLGSHRGKGVESGINQLVSAITLARDNAKKRGQTVTILLENNAGQKNSIGATFDQLGIIRDKLGAEVSICLDTCHAFASGYDMRNEENVEKMLAAFDSAIGLGWLKLIHLNDSKGALGSNLDRHEHLGLGNIGMQGIAAFLHHRAIGELPIIMETPVEGDDSDSKNLKRFYNLVS